MNEGEMMLAAQPVIRTAACKTKGRFSELSVEELISEAQEAALKAVRSWDKEKSILEAWVYRWVWRHYAHGLRSWRWRQRMSLSSYSLPPQERPRPFSLEGFLSELSHDARVVVRMVLFEEDVNSRDELFSVLRDLHWEWEEILKVYREIREAL